MATKWTDEQEAAITTTDKGVIVPAAAGSGKTTVLIERTVRMLEDPDPVTGCPAERLLAVTFTKDAAAQMKRKMRQALADRIVDTGDTDSERSRWLERQQDMLELANISTISSFCLELIKANMDKLEFRSGIKIADETEVAAIKDEAARTALEQLRGEVPEKVELLMDALTNGTEDMLVKSICEFYDFTGSLAFPKKWIADQKAALGSREYADKCAMTIMENLSLSLDRALKLADHALTAAASISVESYAAQTDAERDMLLDIKKGIDNRDWVQLSRAVKGVSFKTMRPPAKGKRSAEEQESNRLGYEALKYSRDKMKEYVQRIIGTVRSIGTDIYEPMETSAMVFSALAEASERLGTVMKEIKLERCLVDFSDIERMALELLVTVEDGKPKRTPLAEQIVAEEWYKVLLIDEFQDVNELQETIFRALSKTDDLSVLGSNVFVVGDLKQSIYRFRLTDPIFFKKAVDTAKDPKYAHLTEKRLTKNFRSRQVVIDLANAVFSTLMTTELGELEYDSGEMLRCGASFCGEDSPCELMLIKEPPTGEPSQMKYMGFGLEELAIAERIKEMLGDGTTVSDGGSLRPPRPSDFCVLTRSNASRSRIAKALNFVGLKARSEQDKGYLGSREILTMVSLLRVIDDPLRDTDMATVLMSPIMGFTAEDVSLLRIRGREVAREENAKDDRHRPEQMKLSLIVDRAAKTPDADKKESTCIELGNSILQGKCRDASALMKKLKFYAVSLPLDALITKIYDETGFLASASAFEDPKQRRANLRLLTQYAASYEKNSDGGISGFLRYLDRVSETRSDLAQAVTTTGGEDTVSVMTFHSSKGLEFPFVFLARLNGSFNLRDMSDKVLLNSAHGAGIDILRHDKLMKISTVGHKVLEYHTLSEQLSEELRLLYVAMTRAEERLIIPFYLSNGGIGRPDRCKVLNHLADEILAAGGVNSRLLSDCRTHGEWLAAFVMTSPYNAPLLSALGREDLVPALAAMANYPDGRVPALIWQFPEPELPEDTLPEEVKRHAPDSALVEQLRRRYELTYEAAGTAASKRTVTEIVAEMRREESGDEKTDHSFFPQLGSLDEEAGRLTAAQRGTCTHLFMELADYDRAELDVRAELERLRSTGRMTDREAKGVYIGALERFFAGDFYRRMKASSEIRREMTFMVSAGDAGLDRKFDRFLDRSGMLQGVCDCIFREDDGYVLVDYKTDGFTDISQLDTYHIQLELYKAALDIILPLPVKACYIYSFKLAEGREILA